MSTVYAGGCSCRTLRYEIVAEPVMMNHCQCRQCQHDSGTGHASYLLFPRSAAKVEGDATEWDATSDGGTVKRRAFCRTCGSPVYMTFPAMPDVFAITAGSLDDPSLYAPQFVLWTAASPAWDHLDPALPTFAGMPPG